MSANRKAYTYAVALLGFLLALSSCRDLDLQPVFYALSQEQPLGDDKGFPDEASAMRLVKITVTSPVPEAGDYYVAAAGRLYIRGVESTASWTVVVPPAGLDNTMCNTLELFGGFLYAGFFNYSSGAGYGLYRADAATLPLAWNPVADTDVQDIEITLLKAVGGDLFVATNTNAGNTNALWYGDGTSFTAVSVPTPAADVAFLDVAQAPDTSYWVLAGRYLYESGAAAGPFALYSDADPDAPVSPLSDHPPSGGLFSSGTSLYVSAGGGYLYRLDTGDWTRSSRIEDDNGDPVRFTGFITPAIDAGAVYAGTQGQGYYRIEGGDVTGAVNTLITHEPSYNIADLYYGAVNFFYYDAAAIPPRLIICTNRAGLWRGDHAGGSTWTWKQE
jgi:hypothetical protein